MPSDQKRNNRAAANAEPQTESTIPECKPQNTQNSKKKSARRRLKQHNVYHPETQGRILPLFLSTRDGRANEARTNPSDSFLPCFWCLPPGPAANAVQYPRPNQAGISQRAIERRFSEPCPGLPGHHSITGAAGRSCASRQLLGNSQAPGWLEFVGPFWSKPSIRNMGGVKRVGSEWPLNVSGECNSQGNPTKHLRRAPENN